MLGGAGASHALVPMDGVWSVVATAAGLESLAPIDGTRPFASAADVAGETVGTLAALTDGIVGEATAAVLAAESTGIASWCVDTAVSYAKVREQFGKPIGAFQAVKHRCADMLAQLELARAATWDAASALDHDADGEVEPEARALAVAVAAAVASDAAVECAKSTIQVLGGIGYTWEHDAHLYLEARAGQSSGARWYHQLAATRGGGWQVAVRAERARWTSARRRRRTRATCGSSSGRSTVSTTSCGESPSPTPATWCRTGRRRAVATPAPVEQLVIDEEFRAAGVHRPDLVIGNWALPTILAARHRRAARAVRRRRRCTATSPGARCSPSPARAPTSRRCRRRPRASRVAGRCHGQKVWTSWRADADWAICWRAPPSEADRHDGHHLLPAST